MFKAILLVGSGGFIGSVLRFSLASFMQRLLSPQNLPLGTLIVNVLGCFLIGFLLSAALNGEHASFTRLFVIIGLLGGFTTFSAFGLETMQLLKQGSFGTAGLNILAQNTFGLAATALGLWLSRVVSP